MGVWLTASSLLQSGATLPHQHLLMRNDLANRQGRPTPAATAPRSWPALSSASMVGFVTHLPPPTSYLPPPPPALQQATDWHEACWLVGRQAHGWMSSLSETAKSATRRCGARRCRAAARCLRFVPAACLPASCLPACAALPCRRFAKSHLLCLLDQSALCSGSARQLDACPRITGRLRARTRLGAGSRQKALTLLPSHPGGRWRISPRIRGEAEGRGLYAGNARWPAPGAGACLSDMQAGRHHTADLQSPSVSPDEGRSISYPCG